MSPLPLPSPPPLAVSLQTPDPVSPTFDDFCRKVDALCVPGDPSHTSSAVAIALSPLAQALTPIVSALDGQCDQRGASFPPSGLTGPELISALRGVTGAPAGLSALEAAALVLELNEALVSLLPLLRSVPRGPSFIHLGACPPPGDCLWDEGGFR